MAADVVSDLIAFGLPSEPGAKAHKSRNRDAALKGRASTVVPASFPSIQHGSPVRSCAAALPR